jgi:hypothetical protein
LGFVVNLSDAFNKVEADISCKLFNLVSTIFMLKKHIIFN